MIPKWLSKKYEEEKFVNPEKFAEKIMPLFVLIVCRLVDICQISIESVRKIVICSLNVFMAVPYLKFYSIL